MIYLPPNNEFTIIAISISVLALIAVIITFVSARMQHKHDSTGTPEKEGKVYDLLYNWGFIQLMTSILVLSIIAVATIVYGFATVPNKQTSILNEAYGIEITDGWDIPMHDKIRPGIKYIQDGQEYIGSVEFEGKNHVTILDETGVPLPLSE